MRKPLVLLLSLSALLFSGHVAGVESDLLLSLKADVAPPVQSSQNTYSFEGIVKLSNCSGSLIRFVGQAVTDNAVVLTNGHCVSRSFIKPGAYIINKRDRRRMRVATEDKRFLRIRAQRILYATMTGTDAAFFELDETFEELERRGVRAFELSMGIPSITTKIEVVSGYWERGYSCEIESIIHELREEDWRFRNSIRYSRPGCETIGGTSGSPIIEQGRRVVVGVNNSGNESGRKCTRNNPCEVDQDENITVIKGASYGQQTFWIYSCLNDAFEVDLSISGCQLTK